MSLQTSPLVDAYDAVVMFTWSNWHTEPRSNRYHFATRFARHLPVIFVQSTPGAADGATVEKIDGHNIEIVHLNSDYGREQSERLRQLLNERGIQRPLYWVYNPCYIDFIERHPGVTHVYHATEDYLGTHDDMPQADEYLVSLFRRLLLQTDLAVAVTEDVARSCKQNGKYNGPLIVLRNGCDYEHWVAALEAETSRSDDKIVIFQGGVNARLDFPLMEEIARAMPDWQFWICGNSANAPQPDWNNCASLPNVKSFGQIDPDQIAKMQARASVGIIPFRQITLMQVSLPLKAFEYVASGLPVVTIPINELNRHPQLFHNATTAAEFVERIQQLAPTRWDKQQLQVRQSAARLASYDARFNELVTKLMDVYEAQRSRPPRLNVLVLYDDGSAHVATVKEHLESFSRYSRHNVFYLPASIQHPFPELDEEVDFSAYDILIVHYSIRVSTPHHLPELLARPIEAFDGPKILFAQDEYDNVDTTHGWIERLKFDAVFTCVPEADVDAVYPRSKFPNVKFEQTLTGYAPENPMIDIYRNPMRERQLKIGYRGRRLPHHYGDLGQEKYWIGKEIRRIAGERGIPVDIEVENEGRIYGDAWYEFLGKARATLGTESGSNVFDHDGSLARLANEHAEMSYEAFREAYLQGREGPVHMNQISPKIFEAIRLRVALVLFEGSYSGVVKPDEHFIPLKKDLSNIDEVFAKLDDISFLEKMVDRAHRDVIESGRYSYANFINHVDQVIAGLHGRRRSRASIISVPAILVQGGVSTAYSAPSAVLPSNAVLSTDCDRPRYWQLVEGSHSLRTIHTPAASPPPPRVTRIANKLARMKVPGPIISGIGAAWRRMPTSLRSTVTRLVG